MCLCAVSTWRRAFSPKPTRTKPRLSGTDNLIGCTRRSCGEGRVSSFTGFGSFRELLCHPRWRARPAVASFAHAFARPRVRVFFSEGLAGHTLGGGVQRLHMGGARSGRLPSAVCCRPGSTGVAAPRNAAETLSYGPGPVPPFSPTSTLSQHHDVMVGEGRAHTPVRIARCLFAFAAAFAFCLGVPLASCGFPLHPPIYLSRWEAAS